MLEYNYLSYILSKCKFFNSSWKFQSSSKKNNTLDDNSFISYYFESWLVYMPSWFLVTMTTVVYYFHSSYCLFLRSILIIFLSQQVKNLIKVMPVMKVKFFSCNETSEICVSDSTVFKKEVLAAYSSNSLCWEKNGLFLLLPLRIFIPVWYIISASCICRLLLASSSAKNKMPHAFKRIWIIYQTWKIILFLDDHTNTINNLSSISIYDSKNT
jgi:hypothetical protein